MKFDQLIRYALFNNDELVSKIAKTDEGIPLIASVRVPQAKYPLVEYHQVDGSDSQFADDEIYAERALYQVGVTTRGKEYEELSELIKQTLRKLDFKIVVTYLKQNVYTELNSWYVQARCNLDYSYFEYLYQREKELFDQKYKDWQNKFPDGNYFVELLNDDVSKEQLVDQLDDDYTVL